MAAAAAAAAVVAAAAAMAAVRNPTVGDKHFPRCEGGDGVIQAARNHAKMGGKRVRVHKNEKRGVFHVICAHSKEWRLKMQAYNVRKRASSAGTFDEPEPVKPADASCLYNLRANYQKSTGFDVVTQLQFLHTCKAHADVGFRQAAHVRERVNKRKGLEDVAKADAGKQTLSDRERQKIAASMRARTSGATANDSAPATTAKVMARQLVDAGQGGALSDASRKTIVADVLRIFEMTINPRQAGRVREAMRQLLSSDLTFGGPFLYLLLFAKLVRAVVVAVLARIFHLRVCPFVCTVHASQPTFTLDRRMHGSNCESGRRRRGCVGLHGRRRV
jgi:hypothetical protein